MQDHLHLVQGTRSHLLPASVAQLSYAATRTRNGLRSRSWSLPSSTSPSLPHPVSRPRSKVKAYYTSLVNTIATSNLTEAEAKERAKERAVEDADLEDLEDEAGGLRGLRSRFSELGDEVRRRLRLTSLRTDSLVVQHFPLFISVDALLLLLECVYRREVQEAALAKRKPVESTLFSLALNYRSHAVRTSPR